MQYCSKLLFVQYILYPFNWCVYVVIWYIKIIYVTYSNITRGLANKIAVHFYTDFNTWLLKQILFVTFMYSTISISIWIF